MIVGNIQAEANNYYLQTDDNRTDLGNISFDDMRKKLVSMGWIETHRYWVKWR
jgi:hypothetical protein